jgi:hypothetical protein
MKIEGSCHCGQITFEAEAETTKFGICHCSECQTLTGTAFNTALPISAAKFVLLSGEPKTYLKTAEQSGRKVLRAFCGDCGSPIYRHSLLDPSILRIAVGSIKQRKALTPVRQIWKCSALPWVDSIGSLESFDRNPDNINLSQNSAGSGPSHHH